jgi:hypothetical protein
MSDLGAVIHMVIVPGIGNNGKRDYRQRCVQVMRTVRKVSVSVTGFAGGRILRAFRDSPFAP